MKNQSGSKLALRTFNSALCGLGIIAVLGGGCASLNSHSARTFRVMTYNIHHGEGLDGKVDLARIAEVIKRERVDLVALQEVDKGVARTQRRDLPAELAALTGMTCVFSNNYHYQGGEYGNAVLTRFKVVGATNLHYTMLRTNEQRGLLQLRLKVGSWQLHFMNTHIDFRGDDSERLANVRQILEVAKHCGNSPIIVCGDFNDTPNSRTHQRMKEVFADSWEQAGRGEGLSYPARSARNRIDYVWVSRACRFVPVQAAVVSTDASDHLPVVVEFQVDESRDP